MNAEYQAYLESDAWGLKRARCLHEAKGRCQACGGCEGVQVHHVTYERIFTEDDLDLLALCRECHEAAEMMIKAGAIKRAGDVRQLRQKTLSMLTKISRAKASIAGAQGSGRKHKPKADPPKQWRVHVGRGGRLSQNGELKALDAIKFLRGLPKRERQRQRRRLLGAAADNNLLARRVLELSNQIWGALWA